MTDVVMPGARDHRARYRAASRRRLLAGAVAWTGSALAGCAIGRGSEGAAGAEAGHGVGPDTRAHPSSPVARSPAPRAASRTDRDEGFARHLLDRLGYGPRPGDVARLTAAGTDAWIEAQLDPASLPRAPALVQALADLPTLGQGHAQSLSAYAALQAALASPGLGDDERAQTQRRLRELVARVQGEARQARMLCAVHDERQLEAVLVEFWFDHFNVFAGKGTVRVTAGFYEREAIRPHVLGRFRELLGATARHPAMLDYLDNWTSVVAGFRAPARATAESGQRVERGPNENYARELLELHTLGADGGFTQADVAELARVFTGWTFDRRAPGPGSAFRFGPARHDDRPKTLLGLPVRGRGQAQGEWALDLLAAHPSTARHVARKLARAFVADDPPASLVERLATRFAATDGDLREVMRALATSPEFADPAIRGGKFRTPYRYVVAAARGTGAPVGDVRPLVAACARMGMPIHGCPTPDGWSDARGAWLNAEGLRQRVDFAVAFARASAIAGAALPEPVAAAMGPATLDTLAALPVRERLGMAMASPDFMRR